MNDDDMAAVLAEAERVLTIESFTAELETRMREALLRVIEQVCAEATAHTTQRRAADERRLDQLGLRIDVLHRRLDELERNVRPG